MKRIYIFLAIPVVVLLLAGGLLWRGGFLGGDQKLLRSIKDKPELVAIFDKAVADEKEMNKNPDDAARYIDAGLQWKSIAELTDKDKQLFFERSLATYEKGIERFGNKNILFYLNAGKVAERINQLEKAAQYYKEAIRISPGDDSGYLYLTELYYYQFHKEPAEILAVFEQGVKSVMNVQTIISGRATYLRRIGDNTAALKDYEQLVKIFPQNPGYREIVQELKQKIQAGEK